MKMIYELFMYIPLLSVSFIDRFLDCGLTDHGGQLETRFIGWSVERPYFGSSYPRGTNGYIAALAAVCSGSPSGDKTVPTNIVCVWSAYVILYSKKIWWISLRKELENFNLATYQSQACAHSARMHDVFKGVATFSFSPTSRVRLTSLLALSRSEGWIGARRWRRKYGIFNFDHLVVTLSPWQNDFHTSSILVPCVGSSHFV